MYIKSTGSGQYLAMDSDGLLYGSVSMRLTGFQAWPRPVVSRNLVMSSDTRGKATISLCLLFFPVGFPPSTLPFLGTNIKSFLWYSLKILKTYYPTDTEGTLIEISVSHPSLASEYLVPLHSFLPNMLLEYLAPRHRCDPCAFPSSLHATHKALKMAFLLWKALPNKKLSNSIPQRFTQ